SPKSTISTAIAQQFLGYTITTDSYVANLASLPIIRVDAHKNLVILLPNTATADTNALQTLTDFLQQRYPTENPVVEESIPTPSGSIACNRRYTIPADQIRGFIERDLALPTPREGMTVFRQLQVIQTDDDRRRGIRPSGFPEQLSLPPI